MTRTDVTDQDRLRASTEEPTRRYEAGEPGASREVVAGGSTFEAIAGLAALVLAIIGLVSSGAVESYMVTIATIVVGAAITLQGAAIGARFARLASQSPRGAGSELGSGVSAAFLGGVAGLVLGVLALLNVNPMTLVPTAIIIFGSAMLLSGGLGPQLGQLEASRMGEHSGWQELTQAMATGAAGAHVLVGLSTVILGILALVGVNPAKLSLVALLVLGGGISLSGGALASHMWSAMRR